MYVLMSGMGLETESMLTHAAMPLNADNRNKPTEEISRGTESTNSCQPSLRYIDGAQQWREQHTINGKGQMDTLCLGDRLHSPGKGVGQTAFYKEICLTQ